LYNVSCLNYVFLHLKYSLGSNDLKAQYAIKGVAGAKMVDSIVAG